MPSDLIRGWLPVRVKKTGQKNNLEPGSDSVRTGLWIGRKPSRKRASRPLPAS
jgi:hypothetical protein